MRVAASLILCACCAVRCEGEVSERTPIIQYLGTGADESRYCQRCEPSNATTQGSTEACKTCQDAKGNLSTASCCWLGRTMLNIPTCPAQRLQWQICSLWSFILICESLPQSDFSLKICDDGSVAHSSSLHLFQT